MFGINSVRQMGQVIEGHFKEITRTENDLYSDRIKICKECPLYSVKDGIGEICDPKKCINTKTNSIEILPGQDVICGCGCRLSAKTRVKSASCVLNKW